MSQLQDFALNIMSLHLSFQCHIFIVICIVHFEIALNTTPTTDSFVALNGSQLAKMKKSIPDISLP